MQASPAYEYDGPPLDVYDDYVPYDDDGFAAAPKPAAWAPAAAPEPARAQDVPPWEAYVSPAQGTGEGAPPVKDESRAEAAGQDPSAADLDAMLAFGFGEGVSFTEV